MRASNFFQLVVFGSSLMLGINTFASVANSAGAFERNFIKLCIGDDGSKKECDCRYTKLRKPKNKGEENLIVAVLKQDDDKVNAIIKRDNNFRNVRIINSLTRGLMACSF